MKYFLFFFILLFIAGESTSQTVNATGKIIYEQLHNGRVQYIEMWFSSTHYMYTTRNRPDDFLIKGKKYTSVEDSLKDVKENEKIKLLMSEGPPSQTWYGSISDNIVLNSIVLSEKEIIEADTLRFVDWQLKDDTLMINGILCQKAEGVTPKGTKLFAWFAPSIPVSVAPFTLRGLPGLLVEVKYDNNSVQTGTLQLEWPIKGNFSINLPDKKSVVSKTEKAQMIQKHNENAMQLLEYYKKQEKGKEKQQ